MPRGTNVEKKEGKTMQNMEIYNCGKKGYGMDGKPR